MIRRILSFSGLLFAALLAGALVACGDDNEEIPSAARTATREAQGGGAVAPTTINAALNEFSIRVDMSSASSGEVTFRIRNEGSIPHEFVVLKTDLPEAQLPVEDSEVNEEAAGIEAIDEQEEFGAGGTETLTVDLDPGRYVFICNVSGHYQLGMHTSFTVTQ